MRLVKLRQTLYIMEDGKVLWDSVYAGIDPQETTIVDSESKKRVGRTKERMQRKPRNTKPPKSDTRQQKVHPALHIEIRKLDGAWKDAKRSLYDHGRRAASWASDKFKQGDDYYEGKMRKAKKQFQGISDASDDLVQVLREMQENIDDAISRIKARSEEGVYDINN